MEGSYWLGLDGALRVRNKWDTQNASMPTGGEIIIAHNAALERQAMAQESIDPCATCITVGRWSLGMR